MRRPSVLRVVSSSSSAARRDLRIPSPKARAPPTPGMCFEKLKADRVPNVPIGRLSISVSIAWATSSIKGMPRVSQRARSSRIRSGRPYMFIVRTAATLDQVASGTASGSMFPSLTETGAITGRRPAANAPKNTASSSSGDMRIRSPGESRARNARWRANRPEGVNKQSRPVRADRAVSICRSRRSLMASPTIKRGVAGES